MGAIESVISTRNWVQIIMVSNEQGYLINSWLDMSDLEQLS